MSEPIDLLTQLITACRCEVSVSVNTHRNYYQSIEQYLGDRGENGEEDADVRAEMIAHDTLIEVQAYPTTPVGFYAARHWDLQTALRLVLDAVSRETLAPIAKA